MDANSLSVDELDIDEAIQQRANGLDQATVNDYAATYEAGTELPPIVAFESSAGIFVSDGFHRLAAQQLLGREEVQVDLRKGSRKDAILYACGANSEHGLRRTNADKRKAIKTLLADATWAKRTDRWIADTVGVSDPTVSVVRTELQKFSNCQSGGTDAVERLFERSCDNDKQEHEPDVREGKDGKKYLAKKPSTPKPDYPAWKQFQVYMMNLAGIEDGLLAGYDRSVSKMVESTDWDKARTVMAINYLDESIKVFQKLRKEFAKHAG